MSPSCTGHVWLYPFFASTYTLGVEYITLMRPSCAGDRQSLSRCAREGFLQWKPFHQLGLLQAQRDHKQLVAFGYQQSHLVGVVNELVEVAEPHEGIRPVEVTCTNRRLLDTGSRSELESAAAPYK